MSSLLITSSGSTLVVIVSVPSTPFTSSGSPALVVVSTVITYSVDVAVCPSAPVTFAVIVCVPSVKAVANSGKLHVPSELTVAVPTDVPSIKTSTVFPFSTVPLSTGLLSLVKPLSTTFAFSIPPATLS